MYTKLNRIGQGTYGVVYKAQSTKTKEVVAIKRIKFESQEEGIPSSAIREIALLKELRHQNVEKLFDVVHSQHTLSLIFEYCDWDLRRYIQSREDPLSEDEVISLSYQLLSALEYIHSQNIIHRDVKPQNLLINRKGELKLADFGLARSTFIPVDSLSTEVITRWYRPPEILQGNQNYGFPVDVWSAGCVVVEMITGQPLFMCDTNEELMEKVTAIFGSQKIEEAFPEIPKRDEPIEPIGLDKYLPRISDELIELIYALLEVDPSKRISAKDALNLPVFDKIKHDLQIFNQQNQQQQI